MSNREDIDRLFLDNAGKGRIPDKDRKPPARTPAARVLDLHGKDRHTAAALVSDLLKGLTDPGVTAAIVVGKGLHSPGLKPVLAETVRELLDREKEQLGIQYSERNGEFQVWLKKR